MGINAKQFAKKHGKNSKKIKDWYEAGYLGAAIKNEKTGIYNIPEDTPLPYDADCRITKLPTFWLELMDASQNQCSIFSSMYPKLQDGTFDRQLNDFVEAGFIRILYTQSGARFLELSRTGYVFMNDLNEKEKKKILYKVEKAVSTGNSLIQAFCAVWPYIQPYITQLVDKSHVA